MNAAIDNFGAMPSAELTPVFSPTDCAKDGEVRTVRTANVRMAFFMLYSFK
jgi:hypothetical protein